MSKTYDNLMEAFAGESQANRKYLAFAAQAEKEGCKQAAKMFRAAAEAETIHALAHLRNAKEVKSTAENLQAAIAGPSDRTLRGRIPCGSGCPQRRGAARCRCACRS